MNTHTEGCLICGKEIIYLEKERTFDCYICGTAHHSSAYCQDNHYICDACHAQKGFLSITKHVSNTSSTNPIDIANKIMNDSCINMHGPEHHYLVAAVLLASYRNAGGQVDFAKALQTIAQRAKNVPGGICGLWGSCGAGISTGIFISAITGANPLSEDEWALANLATSNSLKTISSNGGPRCCKRNTFIALTKTAHFIENTFRIKLELPDTIVCHFSERNKECRKEKCLFHSGSSSVI